jgi:hypothetical protein
MSAIIVRSVNSIVIEDRRRAQIAPSPLVILEYRVHAGIRIASNFIEGYFAIFACVPHQNSVGRRRWEELWEAETARQQ